MTYCKACDGIGQVLAECPECEGSGSVEELNCRKVWRPWGECCGGCYDKVKCPACDGERERYVECEDCEGSGEVECEVGTDCQCPECCGEGMRTCDE